MIVACRAAITTISTLGAEYVFAPSEQRYEDTRAVSSSPTCYLLSHLKSLSGWIWLKRFAGVAV